MDDQTLKAQKIVHWVIWGSLTMAVIIYVVLLQLSGTEVDPEASEGNLLSILLVVSGGCVTVSFAIRFLVTKKLAAKAERKFSMIALPTYIVSLALAESVAVYGLLMGTQGVPMKEYMLFFAVSFFALLLQPPTFLRGENPAESRSSQW